MGNHSQGSSEFFQLVISHKFFVEAFDFSLISASGQSRVSVLLFDHMFVSQSWRSIS